MRPADRLFQIVLLLGRGRVVTAKTLAERLEVSERTIYRDIQDLAASGVPIEGEAGVGYVLRRGYQVPPLMFNEEELQALVFGADVARSWGDAEMAKAADSILAKVDAVLPEKLRPALDSHRLVVPDTNMNERTTELLGEVRDGINRRVRIFLDYSDASEQGTERIVWPLTLLYWGKTWTLGAWCELRQAFRSFRIDRISTLNVLNSTFPDEEGKRLEDYLACASRER
ncbi:MAG: YafY family transcriptional regulator [Gammaproteobacteria bacterium]|nr:MAG: YafY family transcriptional regulator [Gammaproteobacteria bacterium]